MSVCQNLPMISLSNIYDFTNMSNMAQNRIFNYFERNPQLHVLFIFDTMNIVMSELEGVTWGEDYVFHVFDGAWFNTKYNIEHTWKDKHVVLLFPGGICPVREEDQLKFPLLDVLRANMEYKEDDYAAFMQQHGLPEKFRTFVMHNVQELQSARVAGVLGDYYSKEAFHEEVAVRGLLSVYLGQQKVLDWETIICRLIILGAESDAKKSTDFYFRMERNRDVKKYLDQKLTSLFGFSYNPNANEKVQQIAESLKYNCITQLLDATPSDDYKQYKVKNNLVLESLNRIYETGTRERSLSAKFCEAMRTLASNIREEEIIRTYGIDAQYFYMTDALCWPILSALVEQKLTGEPEAVLERLRALSIKLPVEADTQRVVGYIEQVALYYSSAKAIGTMKLNTPEDYVQSYIREWYLLDQHYRLSLERYHELATRDIPIHATLYAAKSQLDADYAKWSNVLNLEWLQCVAEKGEYFDGVSLKRQDEFFQNEYDASCKQVVIVSDALRYEVAAELMQELGKKKHIARLSAYRAMLPTETKFCQPALFPHHALQLVGGDMLVDGQKLVTTEQKSDHVRRYKEEAVCVKYETVMNHDQKWRRELFKRPLVYVLHDAIDGTGHDQSPFDTIAACRKAVDQLAFFINHLHASCNVTNVIVTSDHGFIYNDMQFDEKDKRSITDNCIEKKTRYALLRENCQIEGAYTMPLDKVSGIKADESVYVGTPLGTNRLKASGGYNFAHGGAALQELIIPVIHSKNQDENRKQKVGVALVSHNLQMVSSRLKFQVIQSEAASMTMMPRAIKCCLYHGDMEVCVPQTITLDSTDAVNMNSRIYESSLTLNTSVQASLLQLRIFDVEDTQKLNPLIKEAVKNHTIIEQDFF